MSNVERGLQACRKRRLEYMLASVKALVAGDTELFTFWNRLSEEEKEKEGLFIMFRDVIDRSRPAPGFLPESN